MANNYIYDIDSQFDRNSSDRDSNDVIIKEFVNPMYDNYEFGDYLSENNCENNSNNSQNSMDNEINGKHTDRDSGSAEDSSVVRPKPTERTTIRKKIIKKSDIVYINVPQVCDNNNINNNNDIKTDTDVNHQNISVKRNSWSAPVRESNDLPHLIIELENMLSKMSTDSFYAKPIPQKAPADSPPSTSPPQAKPRRSLSTTSCSSTSSSSLGTRPLPQPPKHIPPPKPPHLPPQIPPPPPPQPNDAEAPVVPPRCPSLDKIFKDNVDLDDKIIIPRKMSEPFQVTQRIPVVDPYYCQHISCKGIARSQTFRSSERHYSPLKPRLFHNQSKGIIQKCGYLWKTGSNRREFLDRWCVLHMNEHNISEAVLAYYVDRKTTSARGKIMLKDIAFIKLLESVGAKTKLPCASSIDVNNFCYFEIGVNCKRGRIYLFAAKCLSDQKLWMNAVSQAIAWDHFTLKGTSHCGYIHMKNGISGQWIINFVLLSGRQMTVISKDFDEQNDNKNTESEDSDSLKSYASDGSNNYTTYDMRKIMSISYASAHQISSCASVQESGQPLCLTFANKVLYLQSEYKSHTDLWYQSLVKLWAIPGNSKLEDQYLTNENIPVAIDKCINYISTYGTDTPNVYLQQNIQSPIANSIVEAFHSNAWDLQLKSHIHSVHDITTALILFLKSMSECILTEKLYHNWIKANEFENRNERLQKFKILLQLLPVVNYITLKKLIAHLVCIIEQSERNHTCILNIAPAICHSILFLKCGDKLVDDRVSTFDGDSAGIDLLTDFILSFGWLFDVTTEELEKERKIQRALEMLKEAKQKETGNKIIKKCIDCEEFLIGVYIYSKEWGKCLNVRLTPTMTAKDLIDYVVQKANIKENSEKLSVFEIVCNDQLERILHYSDIVLGVTLSWVKWSQEFSQQNYLCVKQNRIYDQILPHITEQTPITIFSELKYADKVSKSYKKVLMEFIGAKLSLYKDEKGEKCLGQWNIEDIVWYSGAEKKRSTNNKLSITFIERNTPVVKSKESPYFGRTICCNSEEEYHKWIAGMLCAEYPNGVLMTNRQTNDLLD